MGKRAASVGGAKTTGNLSVRQFMVTVVEGKDEAWGNAVPGMFGVLVQEVQATSNRPNAAISAKTELLNVISERSGEVRFGDEGQELGRMSLYAVGHNGAGREGVFVPHQRFDSQYLGGEDSLATILGEAANLIARALHPGAVFLAESAKSALRSAVNSTLNP